MAALFVVPAINVSSVRASGNPAQPARSWFQSIPYSPILLLLFGGWLVYRFKNPIRDILSSGRGSKRDRKIDALKAQVAETYVKDRNSFWNWFRGAGRMNRGEVNIPARNNNAARQ